VGRVWSPDTSSETRLAYIKSTALNIVELGVIIPRGAYKQHLSPHHRIDLCAGFEVLALNPIWKLRLYLTPRWPQEPPVRSEENSSIREKW